MTLRHQAARVRNRLLGPRPVAPAAGGVRVDIDAQVPPDADDPVDVRDLLEKYTVEELSEAADEYYEKNLEGVDYYFAKPATSIDEAPDFMICFSQVLLGVRPLRGMRVLDFGAGTGWTSRILTQLGYEVVVCDVSRTALDVARQLFERQPVAGPQPQPTFMPFDGQRLDLPDESVDRIFCIDAFHHVPNPEHTLQELGRVLKPGGIAGFQEPGPNHSKKAQSQFEMKNYTVIENDIRMRDIERWSRRAGFTDLKLAVFTSEPFHTSIEGYEDFLSHGITVEHHYEVIRRFVEDRRIFFLSKGEPVVSDSRDRRGLHGELTATPAAVSAAPASKVALHLTARNSGTSIWLPSDAPLGPVLVGAHLYGAEGRLLDRDYARIPLPASGGAGVMPGERVEIDFELEMPREAGEYTVEFDLVAEHVCWFEINESRPATVKLTVGS
jgi:SAM-dependent methyltransferase